MRQLAVPFFALNVMLFLFQLATFLFLEPGSANFVVGILASVFFLANMAIAGALLRSDWDI
jgi:hypothetical protein